MPNLPFSAHTLMHITDMAKDSMSTSSTIRPPPFFPCLWPSHTMTHHACVRPKHTVSNIHRQHQCTKTPQLLWLASQHLIGKAPTLHTVNSESVTVQPSKPPISFTMVAMQCKLYYLTSWDGGACPDAVWEAARCPWPFSVKSLLFSMRARASLWQHL